jgi:hypothetical protein
VAALAHPLLYPRAMIRNEPSKSHHDNRENTMKSIILVAAVIIAAFFVAPKVTALEIDNPFERDDASYSVDFEAPRVTLVQVRGVEPTYDDFGRNGRSHHHRR